MSAHHGRFLTFFLLTALAGAVACGDDDGVEDAPLDVPADGTGDAADSPDAPVPTSIEEIPVTESGEYEGLTARVDAVRDDLGMWHFYGENLADIFYVQGYLQAKDRLVQMELIRRFATGRLAEIPANEGSFDSDVSARFEQHARNAAAVFEMMSDEEKALVEAHCAGINRYADAVRVGTERLPGSQQPLIFFMNIFQPWTPVDVLSIARYQAASLSFDGQDDINNTNNLTAWMENFPADSADPVIAARANAFHDLFPWMPGVQTYNIDGFPNVGSDSGTRALRPPTNAPSTRRLPSRQALEAAQIHLDRMESRFSEVFGGDEFRGSNSWVVSGNVTQSGNPMMANDPHLGLTAPPLFWQAHVNTARAGGNIDVAGQMIAGTPVNILGFNKDLAWGLTTSGYDVTDVYLEQITYGADGAADTVLFNGAQVEIQEVAESILVGTEATTVTFRLVPHHGYIIPGTEVDNGDGTGTAMTMMWTGNEPSNELGAFLDIYTATNVEEARDGFRRFEVGGQTLVVAAKNGDIYYTSSVTIPVRSADARTYDPATYEGNSPCFVLDGTGDHEWMRAGDGSIASVPFETIPHALNPTENYIATANADPVGVTDDGNPLNDEAFIGCNFASGYRLGRIKERLDEMTTAGGITREDMSALQNDALSPHGRLTSQAIITELRRAVEERDTPGTHADLTAAVADVSAEIDNIANLADRLENWSYNTPAAVEGSPSAAEISDSIATSMFNLLYSHLAELALNDEYDYFIDGALDGNRRRTNASRVTLDLMLTNPERLSSYNSDLGQSVLWDDLATDDVTESKGDRVLRAAALALASLRTLLGDDVDMWRWGRLHTLRMGALAPNGALSVPPEGDDTFPNGFPRHGDRDVVDASNFGTFNTERFSYGSGPVQRLVVEMTPDGPIAFNALPGGNAEATESEFHANQVDLWRNNQTAQVRFTEADVIANHREHVVMTPAQ